MRFDNGAHVTGRLPLTRSVAVTVYVTTLPEGPVASAMILAGRFNVGGVVSRTVTLKPPTDMFARESNDQHVTLVVPIGKVEPEPGKHVTVRGPSTRSVAVAVKVTARPLEPVASAVIFAGSESTGPAVSRTLTVKESLMTTPHESVTEQVTVVVVMGKTLPDV